MNSIALRNFDNWNRYLDNKGNILHGKIYFCYKDSNTVAPIYDSDGTELANPIFTDIYGRTSKQVFLQSGKDILVYFYKWIGQGSMTDDDPSNWSLQYTSESMNAFSLDFGDFNAAVTVANMTELRKLDPSLIPQNADGKSIICLLGYNKTGDKEPVYYVWNSASNATDNAGSVIAWNSSASGRWIMVDPSYVIDSKHFGIFPHAAFADSTDDTTQIIRLMEYANDKGLHAYFAGGQEAKYFNVNNYTINSDISLFVNPYTLFRCDGNVTINSDIEGSKNQLAVIYDNEATITINCKEGYTAWLEANGTVNASEVIHINSDPALAMTYSDITCYITHDCNGHIFRNCQIFANSVINSTNTWYNCTMKESFFTDAGKSVQVFYDCIYPLEDWPTTSTWIYYKNSEGKAIIDFGDMQGRTVGSDCSITASKWKMRNATFDSPTISVAQSINLLDCDGTISLDKLNQEIILKNCSFTSASLIKGYNIDISDSSVYDINANIPDGNASVIRSNIAGTVYANKKASIAYSNLTNATIAVRAFDLDIQSCHITADVKALLSESMDINFRDNIINGQFTFENASLLTTNTARVASGVWTGNTCYNANGLINWNSTKPFFIADDRVHRYTYSNNAEPAKSDIHSYYAVNYSNGGTTSLDDARKLTQSEWYNSANGTLIYERFTTIKEGDTQMHVNKYVPRLAKNTKLVADIFAVGTVNIGSRTLRIESIPVFSSQDDAAFIGPHGYASKWYIDVKTSGKTTIIVPIWDANANAQITVDVNDLYWDTDVNAYCYCPCYAYGDTYATSQCGLGTLSYIDFNAEEVGELPLPTFAEDVPPPTVNAIRMRCYELAAV